MITMTRANDNILPPGITLERATEDDAATFVEIHEEAAHWLWARGIHQWRPGAFQRAWITGPIARGELYIVRRDGEAVGAVILQSSDEQTWGAVPEDAEYVHGLRIRRSVAGQGLGRAVLRWAEHRALAEGKAALRLDCSAANAGLRSYYERAGFLFQRTTEHGETALYEKRLDAYGMRERRWRVTTLH